MLTAGPDDSFMPGQRRRLPLHHPRHRLPQPAHPPPTHPPLPPTDQRQSRTLHPHPPGRLGLRRHLRQQHPTHRRPHRLDRLLQSPTTTRRPQPQAAHRSPPRAEQPDWVLHLAPACRTKNDERPSETRAFRSSGAGFEPATFGLAPNDRATRPLLHVPAGGGPPDCCSPPSPRRLSTGGCAIGPCDRAPALRHVPVGTGPPDVPVTPHYPRRSHAAACGRALLAACSPGRSGCSTGATPGRRAGSGCSRR